MLTAIYPLDNKSEMYISSQRMTMENIEYDTRIDCTAEHLLDCFYVILKSYPIAGSKFINNKLVLPERIESEEIINDLPDQ